jgi:tRNA dimethylallyltransferase
MKKSIYIVGPTSSGKSDYAVALAQSFSGEVIGCDSRQIYRYMDIGTGKEPGEIVVRKDRTFVTRNPYVIDSIDHYMIDTHHPNTSFNAGKYVARSLRIKENISTRNRIPMICGGTMFWAQALLENTSLPSVRPDRELRSKLSKMSTDVLASMLRKTDARRYRALKADNALANRPRIIRALEIIRTVGYVPEKSPCDYTVLNKDNLIIVPRQSKEVLCDRIRTRLAKRLSAGMLEEVQQLHVQHKVPWSRIKSFGLEYLWCSMLLRGEVSQKDFIVGLERASYKYAKRQNTWLRRWEQSGAQIHYVDDVHQAHALVQHFL